MFDRVEAFVRDAAQLRTEGELAEALAELTSDLGFRYFALTHHIDPLERSELVRIHNYPDGWERYFDDMGLGPSDPVHRASQLTSVGFAWSDLARMIDLTDLDRSILNLARLEGIGEGYTIPAHVPGEANGSCSFATAVGDPIIDEHLALAQLAGAFAFEAARRIWRSRPPGVTAPQLTDRQRECVIWAARGKSDWEISRILGVSHGTVIMHLKQARERYGVGKRTLLTVHALFDGSIGFIDVFRR